MIVETPTNSLCYGVWVQYFPLMHDTFGCWRTPLMPMMSSRFRTILWVSLGWVVQSTWIKAEVGAVGLSWPTVEQSVVVRSGEVEVSVSFDVENVSNHTVAITAVRPSCGCVSFTKSRLPLIIPSRAKDKVELTVDILGKHGRFRKEAIVRTEEGETTLIVWVDVQPTSAAERNFNQQLAGVDRQRIFRGNCASCHADPIGDQMSDRLFITACAICHQAPHRAEMVPRLALTDTTKSAVYWRDWITHGKDGSLMPAFERAAGGPLSDSQIESLVNYLLNLSRMAQQGEDEQEWEP